MNSRSPFTTQSVFFFFFFSFLVIAGSRAELTPDFYDVSCPGVLSVISNETQATILNDTRMGASLLRLFFHDCFVGGCDASVLIDDHHGEKTAAPNNNSARGFEVIDKMKEAVEAICPGVVSCADILAISARDAVTMLGGPSWIVKLGRKDSRTPHFSLTTDLPSPHANLTLLMAKFSGKGFSVTDLVALSGAHSIGLAKCSSFRDHVYDDSNVDPAFAKDRQSSCPIAPGPGDDNLAPLDLQSPTKFGVDYYVNLIARKGLLHSDQELYNGGLTDILVETYSRNRTRFYDDFTEAMVKMGDLSPSGTDGGVRRNCRVPN